MVTFDIDYVSSSIATTTTLHTCIKRPTD